MWNGEMRSGRVILEAKYEALVPQLVEVIRTIDI